MAAGSHSATHHKLETIRRSQGRSAVQIGAYISRCRSYDERTGLWHDHRARGGVITSERVGWPGDGQSLWNAAEAAETRRNAVTARHTVLALPAELPETRRAALMRGYSLWLRDRYGVAVEWALHAPEATGDPRNHHGHLVETTRRVDVSGRFGEKARELDDRTRSGENGRSRGSAEMEARRVEWVRRCNAELAKLGVVARVDHRSLKRRAAALDGPEIAEKPRHMGKTLTARKRRYEAAVAACARRPGKQPPAEPAFLIAARRRSKALLSARAAWQRTLSEVDAWLDAGSQRLHPIDEAADILGAVVTKGMKLARTLGKTGTSNRHHPGAALVKMMALQDAQKSRKRHRSR